jgi:hypothetical protein
MIFTHDSIDSWIAEGITESADRIGLKTDDALVSSCKSKGDKRHVLENFVSEGNTTAYIILVVSNSFKYGFPGQRMSSYFDRKNQSRIPAEMRSDILWEIEKDDHIARKQGSVFENGEPFLKEVADFLMLSVSVYPSFLKPLDNNPVDFIEKKTRRYYWQASKDIRAATSNEGITSALQNLSENFDTYVIALRIFSGNHLNQSVSCERVDEDEYHNKMDLYLEQLAKYGTALKTLNPDSLDSVNEIIIDMNKTISWLRFHDPFYQRPTLPLLKHEDLTKYSKKNN